MITPLPIATGFYVSDSLPLSAQQCVNWYPHITSAPTLSTETLRGTPGITQVASTGDSVTDRNRGVLTFKNDLYVVNGTTLFRVNNDNSVDNLGQIPGNGRVSMATNGTQLCILVPGVDGYIFTTGPDALVLITDTDFKASGNPQQVVFIDGFFTFTTDDNKFIVSALNDGTSYNALDLGTAESSPDGVVVPFVYKNQLFIGGETTCEAFNNIGGTEFPFQRTGLFLEEGVAAPFSAVNAKNTVMWIGGGVDESPAVWALSGNGTKKISTSPIDDILQRLTREELVEVAAWSYGQAGHYFVGFTLPDTTLVYDISTGRWHERQSRVTLTTGEVNTISYRVKDFATANGRLYATDSQDGRIGVVDPDVYTEYSGEIVRTFATQPFQKNMQPFTVPMLELTVESGVGNAAANDPQIRLSVSRDGAKTYSDDRARSMGKQGDYKRRAVWRRNGRAARFDVYRFTMSDPVKPVVLQLTGDIV